MKSLHELINVIRRFRINYITLRLAAIINRMDRLERRYERLQQKKSNIVFKLYN